MPEEDARERQIRAEAQAEVNRALLIGLMRILRRNDILDPIDLEAVEANARQYLYGHPLEDLLLALLEDQMLEHDLTLHQPTDTVTLEEAIAELPASDDRLRRIRSLLRARARTARSTARRPPGPAEPDER